LNFVGQNENTVAMTLDGLLEIQSDLVRTDTGWEEWDLAQLTEDLQLWTRRNPITDNVNAGDQERKRERGGRNYNTCQGGVAPKACVYCNVANHKSINCLMVKTAEEWRKILANKKL
jgi:hypothetical protein